MNAALLRLYHHIPAPARTVAASLRGVQLRRWRYDLNTERLVEAALAREQWSEREWDAWREERLASLLERAATRVPFYRDQWRRRRQQGDRASSSYLENWPLLDKAAVRAQPRAFLADDVDPRRMFVEHTSGTTGTPLHLWWSRETVRAWYALFEARWRYWYGVSRHDRWGILGGQVVTPVTQRRPPFWVWNAALHQLYLSSYHLAPDLVPYYLDALTRYRVKYLYGYPSALQVLAHGALTLGLRVPDCTVIVVNAEPLSLHQRATIAQAFRCPVRETYGMSEIVAAAGECEAGHLHLWPEAGVTEVMHDDRLAAFGATGDLIGTGLVNVDMPLIRYRVGDRGALDAGAHCACGRTLPMLAGVEGRTDDTLVTPDGRLVGRLDPVFKSGLAVQEAQVVQEGPDVIRIRYVPGLGFGPADERRMIDGIHERMGPVRVMLEPMARLPRGANGKVKAVVRKS